jgi:hypothetical protein
MCVSLEDKRHKIIGTIKQTVVSRWDSIREHVFSKFLQKKLRHIRVCQSHLLLMLQSGGCKSTTPHKNFHAALSNNSLLGSNIICGTSQELAGKDVYAQLLFATTDLYLCETGFSAMTAMEIKQRSRLYSNNDSRL